MDSHRQRRAWLLIAIVLVAAALRAFRLGWGLPDFVFFDTLWFFIRPAARLVGTGELAPQQLLHTPLLVYALSALYVPWRWAGLDAWVATSPQHDAEVVSLELIGRGLVVVLSTLQVVVLYVLARRLFGTRTALLAAASLALLPFPILESHRVNPDLPMVLMALLSAHQAVRAQQERSERRLIWSFVLAGLAGATKYTGLAAVTVPVWVALTWLSASHRRRAGLIALGGLATVLALLLVLAPTLLAQESFVGRLSGFARVGFSLGRPGSNLHGEGWMYVRYVYWLVVGLPNLMGWPLYVASLLGLALLAARPGPARGIVLAGAVPFFVVQGWAVTVEPRYFLLITPWLALLAGYALDRAWIRRRLVGASAAAVILGYTCILAASQVARIGLGPQRDVGAMLRELAVTSGRPIVVAYPRDYWLKWDSIAPELARSTERPLVFFPPGNDADKDDHRWLDEKAVDVVIVPSQVGDVFRREGKRSREAPLLRALADGSLGFERSAHFRTPYVTERLYLWADPALDAVLPAGIVGYEVYQRKQSP